MQYRVTAQIETVVPTTHGHTWSGSKSLPTFELNGDIQGITSEAHAATLARAILDPFAIHGEKLHISAVAL